MNRLIILALGLLFAPVSFGQYSVARQWNELLLESIRNDFARPTVHARNLFHISSAMYDAWALYDDLADPYLIGNEVHGYSCALEALTPTGGQDSAQVAITYATYRLLQHRFEGSPGATEMLPLYDTLMVHLGLDSTNHDTDYTTGSARALGNYIAQCYIGYGLQDNSNEQNGYTNQFYGPVNDPLVVELAGNPDIEDPNRWQPLSLEYNQDQSGNIIPVNVLDFLSPEWGMVHPFALSASDLTVNERDGHEYYVYHDPGPPAELEQDGSLNSEFYKWGFSMVAIWSSHLDTADGVMWDISPGSLGNKPLQAYDFEEYPSYYNYLEGSDDSPGYTVNPATGMPYAPNMVRRGDYARVLAEFWADGPDSETPPGHWFTILNYVSDHPQFEKKFQGAGAVLSDLEWDVKAYFALGAAMHDVAVTAWGIKGWYDYIRPVSAIRYLADMGQCSDQLADNYDPQGIPLVEGYIESVDSSDALAGSNFKNVGKIKLYAWRGPDYISDPDTDDAGVGWILAENWWPYQRPSFVTPPFAGYVSGHSVFSRAASELMTSLTGDAYFPGGMGEFVAPKNEFLVFEEGPSDTVVLQWATYRDASDQTSLSRIWGGIHPPVDDLPGRMIGVEIAQDVFNKVQVHFNGLVTAESATTLAGMDIELMPNPTTGRVLLSQKVGRLIVTDLAGRVVLRENQTSGFDLSKEQPGVYLVHLDGQTRKLVLR